MINRGASLNFFDDRDLFSPLGENFDFSLRDYFIILILQLSKENHSQ